MKHHGCPSSSPQVNSDAEDGSSSQSFLKLQGMGAVQQNPQEPDSESERYEPMVKRTSTCNISGCGQPPNLMNDHGGMFPRVLSERPSGMKASIAPTKDCQAEANTHKDDVSASRACNTKKTTRKLRPVAAMMLKEFTGLDLDAADTKRVEERVKSSGEAAGRSDKLIRLLKARPLQKASA